MNEQQLKGIFQERLEDLVFEKKRTAKLTQNQIADEIGIATSALSNYLNSDREAGAIAVYKIAKYFDVTADYLLGLEEAPTHVEADICGTTGLSEKAVRQLVMNAVYARCERRDLEEGRLGSSGMFYKALDHLIVHGFGILFDIATYLFTDIDNVPEINFTHDNFTVALTNNKEYIFAGILTTINEELSKERDILKNGAVRESELPERPKDFVDNRFELIDKEMREMGIEEW